MERKNTLLLTVIAVATLLVAVVGATFAYFTATGADNAESAITTKTTSIDTVNTSATPVNMEVTLQDMLEDDKDLGEYKSADATLTIEAGTGTGGGTNTCTYDIVYTPVNQQGFVNSSTNASNALEYTIQGTSSSSNATAVITGGTFAETSLHNITDTTPITLVNDATYAVSGIEQSGILTWTVQVRFYNQPFDQTENAGKTYGAMLSFENVACVNTAP